MSEGKKFDQGKPPLGLLPASALTEIAKVLLHGKKKYGAHNWRAGMDWSRLYDASLRHKFAFINGEDIDPESGLSHLAHALCCDLFLLAYQMEELGTDDRYNAPVLPKIHKGMIACGYCHICFNSMIEYEGHGCILGEVNAHPPTPDTPCTTD